MEPIYTKVLYEARNKRINNKNYPDKIMQDSKQEVKDIYSLLDRKLKKEELGAVIPFKEFLKRAGDQPHLIF